MSDAAVNISRPAEIRDELGKLAPYPPDDAGVTAAGLARWMAAEAQLPWARMTGMDHPITMTDIAIMQGFFAAAHALLAFAEIDRVAADKAAAQIRDAFEDGGGIGEWLWEHHGGHAKAIADLARELSAVTVKPDSDQVTVGRRQLVDALTRLDVRVLTSGPAAGMVNAESMADAILEALAAVKP